MGATIEQRLAKNVKDWRQHRAMSQRSAAEKVGLSERTWIRLELADRSPTLDTITKLTRGLGLNFAELTK